MGRCSRCFLSVFLAGLGLSAAFFIFAFVFFGFTFRCTFISSAFLFFFTFLVVFASVIGFVESCAFEDYAGAGPDKPFQFIPAALRAPAQRPGRYRLKPLEFMSAIFTYIVVGRHNNYCVSVVCSGLSVCSCSTVGSGDCLLTMTLLGRMTRPLSV